MASRHLHTCTSKGENFPFSLLPAAFPFPKQRDGNRALSEQPLWQHKSEGARHAQEKGEEYSPRGKTKNQTNRQTNKQKNPNLDHPLGKKPNQTKAGKPNPHHPTLLNGDVSMWQCLFFGHSVGWGGPRSLWGDPRAAQGPAPTPRQAGKRGRGDTHRPPRELRPGPPAPTGMAGRDEGRDEARDLGRDAGRDADRDAARGRQECGLWQAVRWEGVAKGRAEMWMGQAGIRSGCGQGQRGMCTGVRAGGRQESHQLSIPGWL